MKLITDPEDLKWFADEFAIAFTTESCRVIQGKRGIRPRPGVWWLVAAVGALLGAFGATAAVLSMGRFL